MLNTLSRLWAAISRLTSSLDALADTVEETNRGVRAQLGLPGHANAPALPVEVEDLDPTAPETPENGRAKTRSRRGQTLPS
jgi:hypothetical protein